MKIIKSVTKTDIGFLVFALAILAIGLNSEIKRRNLNENSRYTIGITTKVTHNRFGDSFIYFKYFVDSEVFVWSHILDNENVKKEQQYYVIFQSDNPQNSRLLTNKPVSSKVDSIPMNGWDELPL